ncbi:MAG: polynucleotide adenylyltransferase PcnB [Acidobacteria bacterium]|nr:polynucleotide adenylyltransferase PcnB [Acidobacteriota bacterium]
MESTAESIPRVVPRAEHVISRKDLSPNALVVLRELNRRGYKAYLVGGAIRDLLVGRRPKDMDVATDASPNQVKRLFHSCRLIGRRFRLAHVHFRDDIVEVATFRRSEADPHPAPAEAPAEAAPRTEPVPPRSTRHEGLVKAEDGRILRDNIFGTPEQDARRRDFTVNALFYNIADFSIIDYVGGLEDIRNRVIRTIGDPVSRLVEDPVRMVRAVRFAAILGFDLDPALRQAIGELRDHLTTASSSRMYEEVLKLFALGKAETTLALLRDVGLFPVLFPHLADLGAEGRERVDTRLLQAVRWLDARSARGEDLDPSLVYLFLTFPALEPALERLRSEGTWSMAAVGEAVHEVTARFSLRAQIPGKVRQDIRSALWNQGRFRKTRGKYPRNFAASPEFPISLEFLRFNVSTGVSDAALLTWWDAYVNLTPGNSAPPLEEGAPAGSPRAGRRRRRGRRRRGPRDGGDKAGQERSA